MSTSNLINTYFLAALDAHVGSNLSGFAIDRIVG